LSTDWKIREEIPDPKRDRFRKEKKIGSV